MLRAEPFPTPSLHAHHHRGPVEALHHPRARHDADDARVPAVRVEHAARARRSRRHALLGLRERLGEDAALDALALRVRPIQHLRQRARRLQRGRAQQLQPERRVLQAPRGVDAGPEAEAHLPGASPRPSGSSPADLLERADAGALRPAVSSLRARGARGCGSRRQRHHVRDGGQRHQVHQRAQVGLRRVAKKPSSRSRLRSPMQRLKATPGGAQHLGGVVAAGLVRVEHRHGRRQRGRHRVVIHDHHVQAQLARAGDLRHGGDAAVQRHQHPGAVRRDALHRLRGSGRSPRPAGAGCTWPARRPARAGTASAARWSTRRPRRSRRRG